MFVVQSCIVKEKKGEGLSEWTVVVDYRANEPAADWQEVTISAVLSVAVIKHSTCMRGVCASGGNSVYWAGCRKPITAAMRSETRRTRGYDLWWLYVCGWAYRTVNNGADGDWPASISQRDSGTRNPRHSLGALINQRHCSPNGCLRPLGYRVSLWTAISCVLAVCYGNVIDVMRRRLCASVTAAYKMSVSVDVFCHHHSVESSLQY